MRGYSPIPNELLLDPSISIGARLTYAFLHRLRFEAGGVELAELPPQDEIAERLGCSRTALKGYLSELRSTGWIETVRRGRSDPLRYLLFVEPRRSESDLREGRNLPVLARAGETAKQEEKTSASIEAGGSQVLVAAFVDEARLRGIDPPRKVVGHVASEVKKLLAEGYAVEQVAAGLGRLLDRRVVQPSLLANFVMEAALPRPPGSGGVTPGEIVERYRGVK